jgi:ArsR family transcriptional regulator
LASRYEKTIEAEVSSINFYRSKVFHALADPIRIGIVEFLGKDERCVCEIVAAFPRGQSTISKHLNILHEAGILNRRFEGKKTLYKVKNIEVFKLVKIVDSLLSKRLSEAVEAFGLT